MMPFVFIIVFGFFGALIVLWAYHRRENSRLNCEKLAARWDKPEKLSPDEAKAFADDVEKSRNS